MDFKDIENVGIIGLGLMGTSMGLAIKKYIPNIKISAYDINNDHLDFVLQRNIIDSILYKEKYKNMDLIFVAVPVKSIINVIEDIYYNINSSKIIVTDMGSTKQEIQEIVSKRFAELNYIGGHPMTGKETSGPEGASADLFKDKVYIITNSENELDKRFIKFLRKIGVIIKFLKSEIHDKIVSFTSHLPQLLSYSIMIELIENEKKINDILECIGQGFKDFSRIAASDPKMWIDIIQSNKNNIIEELDSFQQNLNYIKSLLIENNYNRLEEIFYKASNKRIELMKVKRDGS
jgi:prephenate dehydrogenase